MRLLPFVLVATVAATTACVRVQTDPVTGKADVDVESPTKKGEVWAGELVGQGSHTALAGTGRAEVIEGKTRATVTLTGATPGATHPWHVHEGKCGSGPIVGDPSAYTPLSVGAEGSAQGSAEVAITLNEAKDYHVNVHLSPAEMGTIIACGNLDD